MGNCASVQDRTEKARSDEIDRQIEEDSRKFRKECKILLLGASFSLSVSSPLYRYHTQTLTSILSHYTTLQAQENLANPPS